MKKAKLKKVMKLHQHKTSARVYQGPEPENLADRVTRLYNSQGGPLIGWLFDEARRRGMGL